MTWADEVRAAMSAAGIKSARALAGKLDKREATVGDWLRGDAEPWDSDKAALRLQFATLAALHQPSTAVGFTAHIGAGVTTSATLSAGSPREEVPVTFLSEERRKGFLEKVLADAARAIREAQAALDVPLAATPVSPQQPDAERQQYAEVMLQNPPKAVAASPDVSAPRRARKTAP